MVAGLTAVIAASTLLAWPVPEGLPEDLCAELRNSHLCAMRMEQHVLSDAPCCVRRHDATLEVALPAWDFRRADSGWSHEVVECGRRSAAGGSLR